MVIDSEFKCFAPESNKNSRLLSIYYLELTSNTKYKSLEGRICADLVLIFEVFTEPICALH